MYLPVLDNYYIFLNKAHSMPKLFHVFALDTNGRKRLHSQSTPYLGDIFLKGTNYLLIKRNLLNV